MTKIKRPIVSIIESIASYVSTGKWWLKDALNASYEGEAKSQTLRGIFRVAYGDEYPEEVKPTGFVTMAELQSIASYLGIGQGQTFIDLGCGRGGPGLWIARETGANLTGIDISDVAVEQATKFVADFGLNERAQFQVGNICDTGLPDASFDGAMSVESLGFIPDMAAAMREVARILRPGACFVFITWEIDMPLNVKDYRPLLRKAGFEVEVYDETSGWEHHQRSVYEGVLAAKDTLIGEMGKAAAKSSIKEAKRTLPMLGRMRRILVIARKT